MNAALARPWRSRCRRGRRCIVRFQLVGEARYRVCVAVVEGLHAMRWVVPVGDRQPLYVGLTGKAILAHLPEAEVEDALSAAERTGADRTRIESQLARVRATGFLADVDDRVAGVGGLSVPIFDTSGVAAALTISGPSDRFGKRAAEQTAPAVLEESAAISAALGAAPTVAAAGPPRHAGLPPRNASRATRQHMTLRR